MRKEGDKEMIEKRYLLTETELLELLKDRYKLAALEAMGVDNWDGYEYAFEDWNEDEYKEGLANYEEY